MPGLLSAGTVYRWVDKDGNIHFSDTPVKGAKKIKVRDPQSYKALPYKKIRPSKKQEKKDLASTYRIAVVKPSDKETISDNDGNVEVEFTVTPRLQINRDHRIILMLDGNKKSSLTALKTKLVNIDRGTHTLSVHIVDRKGVRLSNTGTATFFMRRQSVLHRKAPPSGSLIKRAPQAKKLPKPPTSNPGFKP